MSKLLNLREVQKRKRVKLHNIKDYAKAVWEYPALTGSDIQAIFDEIQDDME